MKDKEDLNGQYKKSKLALTKLESLCRELQKHNRLMKVGMVTPVVSRHLSLAETSCFLRLCNSKHWTRIAVPQV